MERYTEETKPEREFDEEDAETREDLNAVYRYLCHFASTGKFRVL
jgi:hypothetical protein